MTRDSRRGSRWPDVLILLAAAALAVAAVRWADREFDRVAPSSQQATRSPSRPDWVWDLHRPYLRLLNDAPCLPAVATLAVAAILARGARTRGRRRRVGPGAVVILAILLVGGVSGVAQVAIGGRHGVSYSAYYDLSTTLGYRVLGAILGAWVALRLGRRRRARPDDWRDRAAQFVGWTWMADIGLMFLYPLLFG